MNKFLSILGAVFMLAVPCGSFAAEAAAVGDMAYFIAASRYLNVHVDQNFYLDKAIDGLKARSTSRKEFRKLIEGSRHESAAEWANYSQAGKLQVPPLYTGIHNNIQRSRELRELAFKEWLDHWQRSNPAKKINQDYAASQDVSREAMNDLLDAMKTVRLQKSSVK